jgi:hypothetical protein
VHLLSSEESSSSCQFFWHGKVSTIAQSHEEKPNATDGALPTSISIATEKPNKNITLDIIAYP